MVASWGEVQAAMRRGPAEGAEAMRNYLAGKTPNSNPVIVTLSKKFGGGIPVSQMADEMERNPEFYNLMKKVIAR